MDALSPASPVRVRTLDDRKRIGILGGTGLVGRALASRLLTHPSFCLGMIVGSPQTAGATFGPVWEEKERSLSKHYGDIWKEEPLPPQLRDFPVSSFEELVAAGPTGTNKVDFVVSAIAASHGWMEEKLLQAGMDVFSISPYARFDPRARLVVPEANVFKLIGTMEERWAKAEGENGARIGKLFKSPNCVSCGLSVTLQAIKQRYGISDVSVTTFQTLTGRGDLKYDLDLVKGNVYPLRGTVEETDAYIKREVKSIVGDDMRVSVTAQRIFAQRGHFVDVRVKTKSRVHNVEDVIQMFQNFSPLRNTPFAHLPSVPAHPIKVQREAGFPRPVQMIASEDNEAGMSVFVGHISANDEVFDITYSLVVDNIVRGAYGAALINAECFYRAQELEADSASLGWASTFSSEHTGAWAKAGNFFQKMFSPLSSDDPDYGIHL